MMVIVLFKETKTSAIKVLYPSQNMKGRTKFFFFANSREARDNQKCIILKDQEEENWDT